MAGGHPLNNSEVPVLCATFQSAVLTKRVTPSLVNVDVNVTTVGASCALYMVVLVTNGDRAA